MAMMRLVMPQLPMVALGEEERMAAAVGIIVGAAAAAVECKLLVAVAVAVLWGGDSFKYSYTKYQS